MKRTVSILLALVLTLSAFCIPVSAEAETEDLVQIKSLDDIFRNQLADIDYYQDLTPSYMAYRMSCDLYDLYRPDDFDEEANEYHYPISAEIYEEYLFALFYVSEPTLNAVRLEAGYDETENTYDLYYIGGFGGALNEREYQGFKNNGDGTYSVFYATVNYLYLPDDEYENVEKLDWPYEYEYDGKIYENGPDGYTCIDGYLNSGRLYTVSYNETTGIVRIIAQNDYTEADLPESFDYETVPAVIRFEMRKDLGVSFDISEEAMLGGITIRAYKTNYIDEWIAERAGDYCTYSIIARDDHWNDVIPQEPITITFELPEEYERPGVYWYTDYAGDTLEATVDRENGTISVQAFEFGNFVVYDRALVKLNDLFETKTDILDMFFDLDTTYMEFKLSQDLFELYKDWNEEYRSPAAVPAADYEKHLYSLFEVSEKQLQELRMLSDYDEIEQVYYVNSPGGWGGLMPDREYQGYKNNGDGTYSIYYGEINYLYLPGSEDEKLEMLGWPFEYEYNGNIYEAGPEGYTCVEGILPNGRVYTASYDVKTGTVRFISQGDYGEADLPEQFDSEQVPYYVAYKMRYDLGLSFGFEEGTFEYNTTVNASKHNGMEYYGGYPEGLPTTADDFLVYNIDFSVYPQKEYTVTFNIPEGYEVPAVYALNELGKFDEIESTVDKENGTITVNTINAGEFILYDNYRPDYLLGDVNDDGNIDKYDYVLAKRAILNTCTLNKDQSFAADVNTDDIIDVFDYILIKRHVMGSFELPYVYVCNHKYDSVVTPPTETEMGFTTHTCSKCGDVYDDMFVRTENGYSYGLEYVIDPSEKTCTILGIGACGDSDLAIPPEIDGCAVTRIGGFAFLGCDQLINATLPDSIDYIDAYAFAECQNLESINIPDGVEVIEYATFSDCYELKSITLPDSIVEIYDYAFSFCGRLASVNIPDGVTYIGEGAFRECISLTSVEIPESVGCVGTNAFIGCYNLNFVKYDNAYYLGNSTNPYRVLIDTTDNMIESCVIHPDTKIICGGAFQDCWNLLSIEIPYGVTRIESYAFAFCELLKEIVIPDSVTYIGDSAFFNCRELTSVTLPNGIFEIRYDTFAYCRSLKSITIPDGVEVIGNNAFYCCYELSAIILPKSIALIDEYALNECYNLSVYYAGSETEWDQIYIYDRNYFIIYGIPVHFNSNGPCNHDLGDWCINDEFHWMECSLCEEQVQLDHHSFSVEIVHPTETEEGYRCYTCNTCGHSYVGPYIVYSEGLRYEINEDGTTCAITGIGSCMDNDLVIPREIDGYTVTSIYFYAFEGCTQLGSVTLPDTVTLICSGAFKNCEKMTSIDLGGAVSFGFNAFENCYSLTQITIPNGTESVANEAFKGCINLMSVYIPTSLTEIFADTFFDCYNLKNVYYQGTEEQWKEMIIEEGNEPLYKANVLYNCK